METKHAKTSCDGYKRSSAKSVAIGADVWIGSMSIRGPVTDKQLSEDGKSYILTIMPFSLLHGDSGTDGQDLINLVEIDEPVDIRLTSQRIRYRGLSIETRQELLTASDEELELIIAERQKRKSNGSVESGVQG